MALSSRSRLRIFIDGTELHGVQSIFLDATGSTPPLSATLEGILLQRSGFDVMPYLINLGAAADDLCRYEICLGVWATTAPDGIFHLFTSLERYQAAEGAEQSSECAATTQSPADRVAQWCEGSGYTDPFHQEGRWWAFPPNGVMPVAIDSLIPPLKAQEPPSQWNCRCIAPSPVIFHRSYLGFSINTFDE